MSEDSWRTHRLELDDQTLRDWEAAVLDASPEGIVLDRSAFYPGGGGQPPDHGVLLWGGVQTRIADVRKGDDLYLIPAGGDPLPPVGTAVRGAIEDERRTALMRTHSGLHVLCGVVFRDFGALVTGGNMEPLSARMDFNLPEVPPGFREAVEAACNAGVTACQGTGRPMRSHRRVGRHRRQRRHTGRNSRTIGTATSTPAAEQISADVRAGSRGDGASSRATRAAVSPSGAGTAASAPDGVWPAEAPTRSSAVASSLAGR